MKRSGRIIILYWPGLQVEWRTRTQNPLEAPIVEVTHAMERRTYNNFGGVCARSQKKAQWHEGPPCMSFNDSIVGVYWSSNTIVEHAPDAHLCAQLLCFCCHSSPRTALFFFLVTAGRRRACFAIQSANLLAAVQSSTTPHRVFCLGIDLRMN